MEAGQAGSAANVINAYHGNLQYQRQQDVHQAFEDVAHHFYSGALNDAEVPNGKQGIPQAPGPQGATQMADNPRRCEGRSREPWPRSTAFIDAGAGHKKTPHERLVSGGVRGFQASEWHAWTFGPGRAGRASGEKMGPKTRGGLFAQNLPAEVGLGLLLVASLAAFREPGRSPFTRTSHGRLPASSDQFYLALSYPRLGRRRYGRLLGRRRYVRGKREGDHGVT
jgi:hypothetical protein